MPVRVARRLEFTERSDMHKRLWLSVAMLAVGASLLIAASLANAASTSNVAKKGGTWKWATVGTGDTADPQVTYNTLTWEYEFATAGKLVNYPDKSGAAGTRIVPEIAQRYTVSKNGKVYTFYLRKNFKFSDGKKVTAKNFAYAFKRVLSPKISSPGFSFIKDKASTFVKSYKAKGKWKFVVKLKKPSGLFLTEMVMPFFQATSLKLPANKQIGNVTNASQLPSAGPYSVVYNDPNSITTLKKNRFYKHGSPGHHRPGNLSAFSIYYTSDTETSYLQTLKNQYDEGPVPPDQYANVKKQFGYNKSRFWVKPLICTGYIPLNSGGGGPLKNQSLRKAMNYGLNRTNYVEAGGPQFAVGHPFDHIMAPGLPGFPLAQKLAGHVYPFKAKYAKARKLAKGHFGNHKLRIWFRSSGITGPKQKLLITRDLRFLGYSANQLSFKGYPGVDIYDATGRASNKKKFDMALSEGWCDDYPDPYDFINKLLSANGIQAKNGDNWSFFANKKWTRKMQKAARLTGKRRYTAYAKLDNGLTRGPAPWASMRSYLNPYLLSNKVNKKCLVYQGVYSDWDIAAECLK